MNGEHSTALAAAIKTIEAQLEIVKHEAGLSPETGETEEPYHEPKTKEVGRGRKKRTVPTIEEEEEEEEGE